MKINVTNKELDRVARNLFLDPDKDDHISLVNDKHFYNIFGKEFVDKLLKERRKQPKKSQKQFYIKEDLHSPIF